MSNKTIAILVVIFALAVLGFGGYLIYSKNYGGNTVKQTETVEPNTVVISDFAFSPKSITISKGQTVTWQNNDSVTHRVVADDNNFDLGDQASGAKTTHTFNAAGSFAYHCQIHPSMVGTVVVE